MNLSDPNFQLELAANIAVAGSILLAGRNNVHTWWLGIVGCALFAAVFERSHLYADMVLQFFFIAISVLAGGSGCAATMARRCRSLHCGRAPGPGWHRWQWWPPSATAGC